MKLTLNIEKKHLYILMIFLVIIGTGVVLGSVWDGTQSHDTLWTTMIKGKNVNTIQVQDSLSVTGSVSSTSVSTTSLTASSITLGGVARTTWPTATAGQSCFVNVPSYNAPSSYIARQGRISGTSGGTTSNCVASCPPIGSPVYCSTYTVGSWVSVADSNNIYQSCINTCSSGGGCSNFLQVDANALLDQILYCG